MNIKGKLYVEVNVERYRVPDFEQDVRVNNGTVQVMCTEKDIGKKYWINLNNLKSGYQANEQILQDLFWELSQLKEKLSMSKAAMKRKLVEYGIVSK